MKILRYYRNRFHEISEKWIREHRQDYRGNRTGDLQDAYLVKVNAGEETFTEQGLAAILRELFVIGSESESVMMRWAVRIIACYPDVQEKVRAELEAACGRGVEIVWDKRTQLPYTMAVMKCVLKISARLIYLLSTQGDPAVCRHCSYRTDPQDSCRHSTSRSASSSSLTSCSVLSSGYSLPSNTLVMCNYSACHRCPEFWEKPEEFYPEHFLTKEGSLISDKPGFLPYGVGPRICPGAELADMKMFLIIANMIATFNLSLPPADDGDLGTQFEAGTAVLRNPKPFRTVFELRS